MSLDEQQAARTDLRGEGIGSRSIWAIWLRAALNRSIPERNLVVIRAGAHEGADSLTCNCYKHRRTNDKAPLLPAARPPQAKLSRKKPELASEPGDYHAESPGVNEKGRHPATMMPTQDCGPARPRRYESSVL